MPLYPDSPNLNHTPNGSPTKFTNAMNAFGGSPIRQQPFGSRITSHHDDKLNEILEVAKDIHKENGGVRDSIQEALIEFGSLAYRSKDNGVALAHLQEKAKKTEETSMNLKLILEDGMVKLISSVENQRESQKALSLIVDSLLESSRGVIDGLTRNENYLREISNRKNENHADGQDIRELEIIISKGNRASEESIYDLSSNIDTHHGELIKLVKIIQQELSRTSKDTTKLLFQAEEQTKSLVSAATRAVDTAVESSKSSKLDAKQLEKTRQQTIDIQNVVESIQRDLQRLSKNLPNEISSSFRTDHIENKINQVETVIRNQQVDLIESINEIVNKNKQDNGNLDKAEILHDIQQHHDFLFRKIETKLDKHKEVGENHLDLFSKTASKLFSESQSLNERTNQSNNEQLIKVVNDRYDLFYKQMREIHTLIATKEKDQTLGDITQQLDDQNSALTKLVAESSTGVVEKINSTQNVLIDKQDSILKRLEELKTANTSGTNTELKQLFDDLKGNITSTSNSNLDNNLQNLERNVNEQINNLNSNNKSLNEESCKQFKSLLDENTVKHESILTDQLSNSQSHIKQAIEQIIERINSLSLSKDTDTALELKNQVSQLINIESEKLSEKINQINTQIESSTSTSTSLSNKINTISGDVQSLVDFQYGEVMSTLRDNISFIASNLSANQQQQQIEECRAKLDQAYAEISQLKSNFTIFKYHDKEIHEQESLKQKLQNEVEDLRSEKLQISKQIERLTVEMEMKFNNFTQLEQRIQTFEQRLNNTILERSKGILGSTTLAMINNGGATTTSPLKSSSSKRNLSLVPDREERDGSVSPPPPPGKENELTIPKRGGSPFVKGRSVSLFVDH